jgi:protein O-GlcNAc transferase
MLCSNAELNNGVQETFQQALSAVQRGEVDAAVGQFRRVLQLQPNHVAALNLLCVLLINLGRLEEAESCAQRAVEQDSSSDVTFYNYGIILKALKRPGEALERVSQALKINPSVAETWNNRGTVFKDLKRYREAIADFDRAIAIKPNYTDAFLNKGNALTNLKEHAQSLAAYDNALALKPGLAEAWLGRGKALAELQQFDEALLAFERALSLAPGLAGAWVERGNLLARRGESESAFAAYDRALVLKPDLAEAWVGRGAVLAERKQYDSALAAYARALTIKPDSAPAWLGRGRCFAELKQYDEALTAYDKALALNPDCAEAMFDFGQIFWRVGRIDEAFAAYDKAFKLRPELAELEGRRLYAKLCLCDWADLDDEIAHLLAAVQSGQVASPTFPLLAIPSTPADQLQVAKISLRQLPSLPPLCAGTIISHDRIRVAYLSSDFTDHVIGNLTAGLFEEHDRSRFEITAISYGPELPPSGRRDRIKRAFDRFIDVGQQTDESVARMIRQLEIDITVDLNGWTRYARPKILSHRPAPIQVNYLGYIATTGAQFIDYVIADEIAVPFDQQPFFSEKIVHLPGCFLVTDDRQEIAAHTPSRQEAGLPPDGFVFCCFNNSYKITKPVFEIWMRLLSAVPDSILWLAEANPGTVINLRREAQRCGIVPQRIIFAPRLPLPQHLARQRLAGLFLDTTPYNAGGTGVAALWSGVPLLTVLGKTFVGRIAASMLHAVGLPELVTQSLEDYEALALKLAHEPRLLFGVWRKLQDNLRVKPLFDTKRFARNIEAAYTTVWERNRRGEPPQPFAVEPCSASI